MSRGKRSKRGAAQPERFGLAGWLLVAAVVTAAVVIVPGAASSFRLGKWVAFLLCAGAGGTAWLVRTLRRGTVPVPRSPLLAVLALYPALLAVSALWSAQYHVTLTAAAEAAAWVVAVAALAALHDTVLGPVTRWAIIAAAASACVGLFHAAGASPFGFLAAKEGERFQVIGLAGNPADLAAASVIVLPLVLMPGLWGKRKWPVVVSAGVLICAVATTRTLTAVGSIGLAALVLLLLGRGPWRRWAVVGAVVFAVAAGVAMAPRIADQLQNVAHGDWYRLLSARSDGWAAAVETARTHPVLGVGGAGYSCAFADARLAWLERHASTGERGEPATHFETAHSDPLQVTAELGTLGVLWVIALACAAARARPWRQPPVAAGLAAWLPMALLHYPGHLAVTLAPLAVLAAWLTSDDASHHERAVPLRGAPALGAVVVAVVVVAGTAWQGHIRLSEDRWLGEAERGFAVAARLPQERRSPAMEILERSAEARFDHRVWDSARLHRFIGRCRLSRGAPREAEAAFRRALATCGHAEARLGLGLALVHQGRRGAGLAELVKACRLNPKLVTMLGDSALQRTVREALRAARAAAAAADNAPRIRSGE